MQLKYMIVNTRKSDYLIALEVALRVLLKSAKNTETFEPKEVSCPIERAPIRPMIKTYSIIADPLMLLILRAFIALFLLSF